MTATPYLQLPALQRSPGVRHGFFTREGGVSTGLYASLNCGLGSEDAREAVMANRGLAMAALGFRPENLVLPHQVHSAKAERVEAVWAPGAAPKADALVTDLPGVCLGILSADCVPILFADSEVGIVGVAHAGWKGARAGILEAAIEAMVGLGAAPRRIVAGIGPAIRQQSYEVGAEFLEHFADARDLFRPSSSAGRLLFDLPGYVGRRLRRAEIGTVEDLALDTFGDEARMFSYRRGTQRGIMQYGRMMSAIGLL
jgi:YfiH family protein